MLYQLSVVMVFALVFRALDLPVPLAGVLAFAPAVMMLQVIPISFSGLGVREGALAAVPAAHSASLTVRRSRPACSGTAALLLVSMLGAPALALGHRKATPADAPDEESIDGETT